jgi:hypothetical protein
MSFEWSNSDIKVRGCYTLATLLGFEHGQLLVCAHANYSFSHLLELTFSARRRAFLDGQIKI